MQFEDGKNFLDSFPEQLSAATLFASIEVGEFFQEKIFIVEHSTNKPTEEGLEFLNFKSGARVAKKHSKNDDEDDESGYRRKEFMIPVAYPGIVVKGEFLRALPLVHHCVLIRTGGIFMKNGFKVSKLDATIPEMATVIAKFEWYNDYYPIYRIHRQEIGLLPLRKMANLVVPAMPAPERSRSPEYNGKFKPFSFVDSESAVGFLTLYKRRGLASGEKRIPTNDGDADVRLRSTTLWAQRAANDPEWGIPSPAVGDISANHSNPTSELIHETLKFLKRYSDFPVHVPSEKQHFPYLASTTNTDFEMIATTRIRFSWIVHSLECINFPKSADQRGEFVRTILLSFLTSRPEVLMQLEMAPLTVIYSIVKDIAYHMILAGAALIWKNEFSFELRYRSYPVFEALCKAYFGKLFVETDKSATSIEKDRAACLRGGMRTHYDKFAKVQEKDDYPHMYETVDLTYSIRDHPTYLRTLFREKIMYVSPCPWSNTPRWIAASWSDFEMSRDIATWLLDMKTKRVRFVPYKHREMGDIVAGEKDEAGDEDPETKIKLTAETPPGTILFDEEFYQCLLRTRKFTTYDGQEIELADEQLNAVRGLKQSPLSCILGDPGTGKSTLFQVFLKLFGVENVHICCAYNTIASMHSKTALFSMSIDSANARFTRYADPRRTDVESSARVRVLIVDEVGVVKLNHARMLYNVYKPDIMILAGDINQMKAIGRGEILQGLMSVFEDDPTVTTTLTIAHRANAGIARAHISRCLALIKHGRGEEIYGMVDRIAAPPITFLSHRSANTSTHIANTLEPLITRFRDDMEFWKNFIGICRTHNARKELQDYLLINSPLTRDIVRRRFLGRRDLAVGEVLKVVSRFKPYEREAPPLVPPELGNGALTRVTRIVDIFTDMKMKESKEHIDAVLGGYLSKEELIGHLAEIDIEDLESTLAPTSIANKTRRRARLIILDGGAASFILTDKTRECYERGNVVTAASVQGGQFDNVMLYFTPPSSAAGLNTGAFTEEKSMLYTGASRAKKRIFFIGSKTLVGEISRRVERPRRNLFTCIIRQLAGMTPFRRSFEGEATFNLPLDEADYMAYETHV